jgi:hypothetical protein
MTCLWIFLVISSVLSAVMQRTDSFMNRTVAKQENSTGHVYVATEPEVE